MSKSKSRPPAAATVTVPPPAEPVATVASEPAAVVEEMKRASPSLLRRTALAKPFDPGEVCWEPIHVMSDEMVVALPYVGPTHIMDRLDEVYGIGNWATELINHGDGVVGCVLSVNSIPDSGCGGWVKRSDVGGPGLFPPTDPTELIQRAYAEAFVRAANQLGIGRYLCRIPAQVCQYNPATGRVTNHPALPAFATPKATGAEERPGYREEAAVSRATSAGGMVNPKPGPKAAEPVATVASPPPPPKPKEPEQDPHERYEYWENIWRETLIDCSTPDDLNAKLAQLTTVPQQFKQRIWDYIRNSVVNESVGWLYNRSSKRFYTTPVEDVDPEAIPF